jgi:hypothetical protein
MLEHSLVIECGLLAEFAEVGFLVAGRFVPVSGVFVVRHGSLAGDVIEGKATSL